MTVKGFFKSTSFKCIVTLLCVLLVSGIFLTIMNSLLAVTDQERFDRAINKIYGKPVKTEAVIIADYENDNADINEAYKIKDDGNYLIKATGKGGYDNGTVTCWVVVSVKGGSVNGIDKVVVDSNKGQSYIGNISNKFLDSFKTVYSGEYFTPYDDGFIKTGATFSATAICNAVNGAMDFVNAKFGNITEDKYKEHNFMYLEYVETRSSSDEVITDSDGKVSGVKFTVRTKSYGNAAAFTVEITVDTDGYVNEYKVVTNGSTGGFESNMDPVIADGSWFVGKNIKDIQTIFTEGLSFDKISGGLTSNGLKTGATQSSYLCIYAAAFATANYEKCLPETEEPGDDDITDEGSDNTDGGEANE